MIPWVKGLTLRKIAEAKHGLYMGPLVECLPGRLFTKNKRINAVPERFAQALTHLQHEIDSVKDLPEDVFDLLLISRRNIRSHNSWFHNIEAMHKKNRCTAWISPMDADRLGIITGTKIQVKSRVGDIDIEAEVTDRIMPGVISIPHGWGHHLQGVKLSFAQKYPGVSVNDITDNESIDTLCGNAALSGVPVKISQIGRK